MRRQNYPKVVRQLHFLYINIALVLLFSVKYEVMAPRPIGQEGEISIPFGGMCSLATWSYLAQLMGKIFK